MSVCSVSLGKLFRILPSATREDRQFCDQDEVIKMCDKKSELSVIEL